MLVTPPRLAASEIGAAPFDDHVATRLLHGRMVVLGTQVDEASANRVCAQLLLLAEEDPRRDIVLCVNSPGGSVHAGMAVYDTMRFIPNDVVTLGMGIAASMGQFLLCAGTPGKRYALPHTRVMMHQPSGGLGGTAADIAVQAENLAHTKSTMQRLIAEHTGQPLERVVADQRRDRWFTAEEARDYGFVDQVVRSAAELGGDAARRFGFSADGRGARA
ncbi:ClpP family protease [Marinactinospora thermotolerans]|uniref:ATP-dependent Clp protease proteolytic subunit n=1 Tax=Marinactinospora thermotolerans DSM 45154 TaxID=1122192 RepID=A0A1T4MXW3_9ACTN|nr:ATP-dependent Clp protease proteolytic subunit [Marinactinospora thermotolerans]SJZ71813.1 ATP-dependent Clp protease proteolytic subunit ClpP [Marinactinospora thermotolerans DSM 45154]